MLRREFANAVGYLNQILYDDNQLKFIHWDFHKFAKRYEGVSHGAMPVLLISADYILYFSASLPMFWQFLAELPVRHLI